MGVYKIEGSLYDSAFEKEELSLQNSDGTVPDVVSYRECGKTVMSGKIQDQLFEPILDHTTLSLICFYPPIKQAR